MRPLLLLFALVALPALAEPVMTLQPATLKPGDPLLVTVRGIRGAASGVAGGRKLHFYPVKGGAQAVTGVPVEQALGVLTVHAEVKPPKGAPVRIDGKVQVMDPAYPARELKVEGKYVDPPPAVKAQMAADRAAFAAAFSQPRSPPLFKADFVRPREAVVTAPYGDLRTFNGKKQSQHYGIDLEGAMGTPILAANAGKVVMARDCYGSGSSVVVHHGAGLFTAYFHMSRIDVKVGTLVKAGQQLGLVGKTGRVTGPHLHWGVKADGLWVDGKTLLELNFF